MVGTFLTRGTVRNVDRRGHNITTVTPRKSSFFCNLLKSLGVVLRIVLISRKSPLGVPKINNLADNWP